MKPHACAVGTLPHPERYPVDTGLFVSGGMDGVVKVWDTNTLGVVLEFDFKDKVRVRENHRNTIVAWTRSLGALFGVPVSVRV